MSADRLYGSWESFRPSVLDANCVIGLSVTASFAAVGRVKEGPHEYSRKQRGANVKAGDIFHIISLVRNVTIGKMCEAREGILPMIGGDRDDWLGYRIPNRWRRPCLVTLLSNLANDFSNSLS